MSKPTVVILAGGSNSRFFPFNTSTHKGAFPLLGEKLVVRTLRNLEQHGFTEVVIVVSAKDFNDQGLSGELDLSTLNMHVQFVLQPAALGMGDALLAAAEYAGDQFCVIAPYHVQAGEILSGMLEKGVKNIITSTHTDEPWNYGILTLANGRATAIHEKPAQGTEASQQKIQVMSVLSAEFLSLLKQQEASEYNFETALNTLMQQAEVAAHTLPEPLPTLKFPWHLFDFQAYLFKDLQSHIASSAKVAKTAIIDESHGPVMIAEGATIGDFAKLSGPCYIGKNVLVGDYAFVRGSSLEADSQIGAKTEVVRSIILTHSSIHFGYLADSIVGHHIQIGAGLITANKRLDRQPVLVEVKGQKMSSQRQALGIMIGDNANVGIRVSTMPGVCVGSQAVIFPGQVLYHNVDHHQVVKS